MLSTLRLRARPLTKTFVARSFAVSARHHAERIPKPPPPIEDSTSALNYKSSHRTRPPPLPPTDLPRDRTVEEAVTNILYNTPPPSLQPFKKHVLNCLVQNEPGVLSRVSGILAARGFNIDSLVVCSTEVSDLSRMCIVLSGQDGVVEQARRQLEDLVPVWAVLDYTDTRCIERELLLVKVSILGPDYLDDQLIGGPSHDPRRGQNFIQPMADPSAVVEDTPAGHLPASHSHYDQEVAIAEQFEHGAQRTSNSASPPAPLTASEMLRLKSQILHAITMLADQFNGKIVDMSDNSVIVELSSKSTRVDAFLKLIKPFGILESARTGAMVMPRTPIGAQTDEQAIEADVGAIDASLLPPG